MTNRYRLLQRPLSRRTVLTGLGSLTAALSLDGGQWALAEDAKSPSRQFPNGFTWGVAASAPQTESANGRGESIWDVFAATPGRIRDVSDMRVGTAFEEMYATDFAMVADAGIKAFRFSFAWPRVQPDGKGPPNASGLDLYDRMLDTLLARGLEPWATTFHWDIPAALGDWRNRDVAFRFADYTQTLAKRFGDRIRNWIVLNEPGIVALLGYAFGSHAPGLRSRDAYLAATHHQNLGQGLGFQVLRQTLRSDPRIGTALAFIPVHRGPGAESTAEAAGLLDAAWNRAYFDPLFGRPYPSVLQPEFDPLIQPGDMRTIAAAPDFLGVNYYSRLYAVADPGNPIGAGPGDAPPGRQRTNFGWPIEPDGLEELLLTLRDECAKTPIYVTEFGASFADPPAQDGVIPDTQRVEYLRAHLSAIRSALAQGSQVAGAFCWSATDNWEWAEGFTQYFGLIQVDRTTQQRIPKQSLHYYGECAIRNAVV